MPERPRDPLIELQPGDELDGCELDFAEEATTDDEAELFLEALASAEARFPSEDAAGFWATAAQVGIASQLRADKSLTVREVPGWQTRGRVFAGFTPKGGVNHHTAGAKTGSTPSLRICIEGRSDLPGPLCNVYLGRDKVVYVVAAGSANHAGLPDAGVLRGMRGNSDAYGLEIEHSGTEPLSPAMVAIAAKVWACLLRAKGLPASQLVQHHEWAPSRKIDLATNMHKSGPPPTADGFRLMVARLLKPPPKWQFRLVDSSGKVHERSAATGRAGYAARLVAFTTRVAALHLKLTLARKRPQIRAFRVQ